MEIPEISKAILKRGTVKVRVIRSGMYQQITFSVKKIKSGNIEYVELFTDRVIDISELKRVAEELKLPVAAQNAIAFPEGKSAEDYKIEDVETAKTSEIHTENTEEQTKNTNTTIIENYKETQEKSNEVNSESTTKNNLENTENNQIIQDNEQDSSEEITSETITNNSNQVNSETQSENK